MSAPFSVHIVDAALADKARDQITLGGRFVFIDDAALLDSGRRGRLQSWRTQARKVVKAVVDGPLTVSGLRLTSTAPVAPRACALVADRDLYRTETDTARIVAVLPRLEPAERARLDVTLDGQALTSRAISAADGGLVVEPFGALVAGAYQASLLIDDVVVAGPVDFTVADYTLAPLSVRLRSRHIEGDQLVLGLTVETWQVPCVEQLRLSLVEGKRVHEVKLVHSEVPGRYDVAFTLRGEGALRVRAVVEADPSRSAECSIPGSRRSEREQIVVSELGREVLLSMLPTPRSLPVRGLHLEQGDVISTPIVVDDVVTATPSLRTIEAVEALTLAWWLPLSGTWHVEDIGDIAAGQRIALQAREPLALCFVGCFVDGGPFEAMTTFMRPDDDGELLVSHPAEVRPRGLLPVTIKTVGTRRVLLAIKDERLTSTDTPQVALQAKLKDGVTTLASVLGDDFAFTRVSALSAERGRAGLKVLISKTGTSPREERFFLNEVTIGSTRSIGNDIVLDGGTVSKRHARVVMRDDKLIVVDLQSTNGTFINGKRISAPQVLRDGDRLIIGDYWLRFELTGGVAAPAPSWDAPDEDFDSRTLVTARAEEMAVRRRAPAGLLGRSDDLDDLDDLDDADDADDADDDLRPRLLASASASAPASRREPPADRARAYAPAPKSPRMEPTGGAPQALSAPGSTTPPRDEVPVDDERPRETFPEILFFGVIEVDGEVTVEVPVGESLAAFQVLAFTLVDGAPAQRESRVQVDQPARADLDLPLEIADGDVANAVLRVSTRSGRAVVSLTRDGVAGGHVQRRRWPGRRGQPRGRQRRPADVSGGGGSLPGPGARRADRRARHRRRQRRHSRCVCALEPGDRVSVGGQEPDPRQRPGVDDAGAAGPRPTHAAAVPGDGRLRPRLLRADRLQNRGGGGDVRHGRQRRRQGRRRPRDRRRRRTRAAHVGAGARLSHVPRAGWHLGLLHAHHRRASVAAASPRGRPGPASVGAVGGAAGPRDGRRRRRCPAHALCARVHQERP
jgi:predicted component of type VI protein secretion system